LKQIEIGTLTLKNVNASVVHNQQAPLLLGQSALGKFGKVEIDNKNSLLYVHYQEIE
jgi:aspartyl protease family protein